MADSAGQPLARASRPSPSPSPATGKSTVADSSGSATNPPALGTSSGNVGIPTNASTQQNAGSKPVYKMKRTGFTTLPYEALLASHASYLSRESRPEPEPAKIISDILPPLIPTIPARDASSTPPMVRRTSAPTSDSLRKTKYVNEEERRKATSLALKRMFTHQSFVDNETGCGSPTKIYHLERWASGAMDHVHKKRVETMRRRKEAESLLGTPGITKPSQKISASPIPPPRLSDLASSADHDRRRSGVSEKLARLFDKPVSVELADLLTGPRSYRETSDSTSRRGGSVASNADMLDDTAELSHDTVLGTARPPPDSTLNKGNDGDVDSEGDSGDSSSASSISNDASADEQVSDEDEDEPAQKKEVNTKPIIMAAPDRAYTKWKGSCLDRRGGDECCFLTQRRRRRILATDPWCPYSGRLPVFDVYSGASMGLSSAIVPQGIRKACTAWQPLYCKSTTLLVATWSKRLMQDSASIEVHSCTTMKMGPFQNAASAFYAALTAGRRRHSRL